MSLRETKMDIAKQSDNESTNKIECRACLQIFNEECVVNLFQAWTPPWDGMGLTIAEDLAKIANIKLQVTDIHSKVICITCCQKLKDACIFTIRVSNNDLLLKQRCSEKNLDADEIWPKPIQLTTINGAVFGNTMNVEVKQEVLSDDEYYNANSVDDDYLNLDIKIEPEEILAQKPTEINAVNGAILQNSTVCKEATLVNGNNDLSELNLNVTVKEEPLTEDEEPDSSCDLPLECMLCAKTFNSISGLKSHVIAQHSYKSVKRKTSNTPSPRKVKKDHICTTCRRSFATSTDLLVHETCHNQFTCYGCNDKFATFSLLATHRLACLKSNGGIVMHKSLDDVKRPKLQMEAEENSLKCEQCNQRFTDPFYLSVHMEVHQPADVKPLVVTSNGDEKDLKAVAMETQNLEDIFTDNT